MSNRHFAPQNASPVFIQWCDAVDREDDGKCEALIPRLTAVDMPHIVALYRVDCTDSFGRYRENRRWWAVRALAELGGIEQVDILLQALNDPSADVRAAAAHCVAQVGRRLREEQSKHADLLLRGLANLLLDELGFVRQTAADALAQLGARVVPMLHTILNGSDEGARTRAAYVLRKIQSKDDAAALFPLLEDHNPMVRLYVQEALEDMGLLGMVYFRP